MQLELEELRTFVLIVDAKTLSAAARTLRVTTNAVSRRLARLEERFEVRLLHRTTRSLSLTDEGRRLYMHAQRMLRVLEEMEGDLKPRESALEGTVRLALPVAALDVHLLTSIAHLLDEHPQLSVQLCATHAPLDAVAERIDIEVVVGAPKASGRIARKLGAVSWVLAASPAYLERHGRPTTPTDLARHRCLRLLGDRPQDTWSLFAADGSEVVVPVGGSFECDDSRALGDAVYAGVGIGLRDPREIERSRGQLERVLPEYLFGRVTLYAVIAQGRLKLPRVRRVLAFLQAALRERLVEA